MNFRDWLPPALLLVLSYLDGVDGKGGYGSRGGAGGGGFSLYGRKASSSYGSVYRSPRMSAFIAGAGIGYLAGRSHHYYYTPMGYHYGSYGYGNRYWAREKNVCSVKVPASEVRRDNSTAAFEESSSQVTLYFMCDGSCCDRDCCEVNGGFIAFIVIGVLVGLCVCAGCCYKLSKDETSSVGRWTSSMRRDPAAAQRGAGAARDDAAFTPVYKDDSVNMGYPNAPVPPPSAYDPYGTGGAAQPPSYNAATAGAPTYNPYAKPPGPGFNV